MSIQTPKQILKLFSIYRPRNFFLSINRLIDNGLLRARPDCDKTLLHLKHIVHRLWYTYCCTQPQMASDDAALTADGRALHVCAADSGNVLSPSVERVVGTTSVIESPERRRRRASIAYISSQL